MDATLFHEPRRRLIPLRDGEMAALDFGDGARPVDAVFLHANGLNAMTYRSVIGPLSLSMRIVACDLRGHGRSRLPTGPGTHRSWGLFRDDLLAGLDALGPQPVIFAGHAMGATVALMAAARAPERTRALVLFEPVIPSPWASAAAVLPGFAAQARRALALAQAAAHRRAVFDDVTDAFASLVGRGDFRSWPEVALADYLADGLRPRADGKVELACTPAWEAANHAALANGPRSALRRVRAPVLILKGTLGSSCRLGPRQGRVEIVPGTGRFLPLERPDVVRDALLDAAEA
jgi:pimeloyl-ACP methyl ester carboxylesterase